VFVQGIVWGINSFDQWGVELGKVVATTLLSEMAEGTAVDTHDGSTNALMTMFNQA
jgi:glucose-6-phosphate isomerase